MKGSKSTVKQEEKVKYLNNINTNINSIKKIFHYCSNCNKRYPLDMMYCPRCHGYLYPVPYSK